MPALAALFAALGPWISRFFMLKGATMFAGFLGRLGLVLATDEFVMEPLVEHVMQAWASLPPEWHCWLALFGVTKGASIIMSGLTLLGAKRVFFGKA